MNGSQGRRNEKAPVSRGSLKQLAERVADEQNLCLKPEHFELPIKTHKFNDLLQINLAIDDGQQIKVSLQ